MSLRTRRQRPAVDTDEIAMRRVRFAIVNLGVVIGRSKTALYLQTWANVLKDDHSPESRVMDEQHEGRSNELRSESDHPSE